MKNIKLLATAFAIVAVSLIFTLTLTAAVPASDLPPRPPTPTPIPTPTPDSAGDAPIRGAFITLRAWNASPDAWTVVQWQDALGDWHDVEGWRGRLDDKVGVEKTWWVAPRDFETGPFRWLVYAEPGGELLGASDAFYLPERTGQVVTVDLLLP